MAQQAPKALEPQAPHERWNAAQKTGGFETQIGDLLPELDPHAGPSPVLLAEDDEARTVHAFEELPLPVQLEVQSHAARSPSPPAGEDPTARARRLPAPSDRKTPVHPSAADLLADLPRMPEPALRAAPALERGTPSRTPERARKPSLAIPADSTRTYAAQSAVLEAMEFAAPSRGRPVPARAPSEIGPRALSSRAGLPPAEAGGHHGLSVLPPIREVDDEAHRPIDPSVTAAPARALPRPVDQTAAPARALQRPMEPRVPGRTPPPHAPLVMSEPTQHDVAPQRYIPTMIVDSNPSFPLSRASRTISARRRAIEVHLAVVCAVFAIVLSVAAVAKLL